MRYSPSTVGAVLSVIGLAAWMSLGESSSPGAEAAPGETIPPGTDGVAPQTPLGSAVPCAVPLVWRISRIDEEFQLSGAEARMAVREGAALWEDAVGHSLFINDPTLGFPIRFIYDDRQAATRERDRTEAAHREAGERLDAARVRLEESTEALARNQERYRELIEDFERRLADHNGAIREWNRRGGAPRAVLRDLRETGEAFEAERRELRQQQREIEAAARSLRDDEAGFNRGVEEHNRRGEELEQAFPATRVESGLYRELAESRNGRIVSVERQIMIYRFTGLYDLRLVVAHELGHALGLGHTSGAGAVMSAQYTRGTGGRASARSAGVVAIQPADLELLGEVCPDL